MKTTQRNARLALLVGAVLMAALAVAAALLLRQNDLTPAEKKGSQEIVGAAESSGAPVGNENDHRRKRSPRHNRGLRAGSGTVRT